MAIYPVVNKASIAPLFANWQETFIWSCLQDCMGDAYSDHLTSPQSAKITLGDISFLAGEVNYDLIRHMSPRQSSDYRITVPQNPQWEHAIEQVYPHQAVRRTRYATRKDPSKFNTLSLQAFIDQLPPDYSMTMIDQERYDLALSQSWSADLCSNYECYEDYQIHGLGIVIMKNGEIVSGASSYAYYHGGIEVEIDTREDERRKGLALICGAKLILECLTRALYPSWDAHSKASLALAEKLGYVLDKEYTAYEIFG